jgi:hypothetical protein
MARPTEALQSARVKPVISVTNRVDVMNKRRLIKPTLGKAYLAQRLFIQLLFPQCPPRFAVVEALAVFVPAVFVVILIRFHIPHGRGAVRRAVPLLRQVRTAGVAARQ